MPQTILMILAYPISILDRVLVLVTLTRSPETEFCETLITLTCPCNRIQESIICGRTIASQQRKATTTTGSSSSSSSYSAGHHSHAATPKFNNDCQTAKALEISQEGRDNYNYNDM